MVYVIGSGSLRRVKLAVIQLNDVSHNAEQVFVRQHSGINWNIETEALVQLVAANLSEVIAARIEQKRVAQVLRIIPGGGVAGAQPLIKLYDSLLLGVSAVFIYCSLNVIMIEIGI